MHVLDTLCPQLEQMSAQLLDQKQYQSEYFYNITQARTTTFGPDVQNNLFKIHFVLVTLTSKFKFNLKLKLLLCPFFSALLIHNQ